MYVMCTNIFIYIYVYYVDAICIYIYIPVCVVHLNRGKTSTFCRPSVSQRVVGQRRHPLGTCENVPALYYLYYIYINIVPPLGAYKTHLEETYTLSLLVYTVNVSCFFLIYIYILYIVSCLFIYSRIYLYMHLFIYLFIYLFKFYIYYYSSIYLIIHLFTVFMYLLILSIYVFIYWFGFKSTIYIIIVSYYLLFFARSMHSNFTIR